MKTKYNNYEPLFEWYNKDNLVSKVYIDKSTNKILIENLSNDIYVVSRVKKEMNLSELSDFFLKRRCFPMDRTDLSTQLEKLKLKKYDPESICRITHGQLDGDSYWIKWGNENIDYSMIKST